MTPSRSMLAAVFLFAACQALAADPDQIRSRLQAKMPDVQVGAVSKTPYAGLYEAVINGLNVVYTDERAQIVFIGRIVELNTQADLTERRTRELQTVDFRALPLDKAIVTVRG